MNIVSDEKPSIAISKIKHATEGKLKVVGVLSFTSECMCCAFNQQGQLLAVGLSNGLIKVYSIENNSYVYSLQEHSTTLPVTCLKWKPDNSAMTYGYILMATYASGECKIWHVTTSKCLHTYTDNQQLLVCAYNGSGNKAIAGGSDGIINVYDVTTNQKILRMQPSTNSDIMDGHVMRVFSVQYHPYDNHVFVSGGWDDTVQWWDTRISDKHSIKKISGPHICGEAIDIEPNTLKMVAASWRKFENLQVFDFGTGKLIKDTPLKFNQSMLYCAQWKDSETILSGGSHGNMMQCTHFSSFETVSKLTNLYGAVYSIDNNRVGLHPIVAVCSDKNVYLVESTS
ncbi:dynein assembly factor with WD repeat domains 1 isoform X1 [Hydra vulgaris]|uniref:dynein assembly factor with WD repeat domains 1 isoform X1 n=1 Tax=Hydra vulgaris TaxID=6087 RepID=UPI0001925A93|nr:dynein assembly factor with WDR repeat domains 1 [Hydra vulgaris]